MTAQTVNFLKNTLLAPGQAAGSITPVRMEDIPDSFPPWDDPANVSTLGAPAILRGTVSAYNLSGLVVGAGQTTPVQQANATILQTAINYCVANHKFMEMPPGIYEINSSTGLTVGATGDVGGVHGFTLRGAYNATQIVQYYATSPGAPILTVGDVSGTNISYGVDIQGIGLSYGAAQTGFTSSTYLKLGKMTMGVLEKMMLGYYVNPAYNGLTVSVANFGAFFSNRIVDIEVASFQNYGLLYDAPGSTSNHFDNIYITNQPTAGPVTSYIFMTATSPNLFTRLNLEWGSCNKLIDISSGGSQVNLQLDNLHIEGITMTGADPCIFYTNSDSIFCSSLELVNPIVKSANLTGTPALIYDYIGATSSNYRIDNLWLATDVSGNINTPFSLYHAAFNPLDDYTSNIEINGGMWNDTVGDLPNRIVFDTKMPVATFRSPSRWSSYSYGPACSIVKHAFLTISSTYTHYGQYEDAVIQVPASITAFTITLANTMGATGTQPVRTGNTVRIRRRQSGFAGTLTIAFGGTGSPTTNSAAGTADFWFVFDGAHWQTFTPVTS